VGVVIVVHALEHGCDPLQTHAGIDRGPRQLDPRLGIDLLILHENKVPDLDEPVAIRLRRSWRAAPDMLAMIVEDLRTGAAGARIAHRPEIVRGWDADDPGLRQ